MKVTSRERLEAMKSNEMHRLQIIYPRSLSAEPDLKLSLFQKNEILQNALPRNSLSAESDHNFHFFPKIKI